MYQIKWENNSYTLGLFKKSLPPHPIRQPTAHEHHLQVVGTMPSTCRWFLPCLVIVANFKKKFGGSFPATKSGLKSNEVVAHADADVWADAAATHAVACLQADAPPPGLCLPGDGDVACTGIDEDAVEPRAVAAHVGAVQAIAVHSLRDGNDHLHAVGHAHGVGDCHPGSVGHHQPHGLIAHHGTVPRHGAVAGDGIDHRHRVGIDRATTIGRSAGVPPEQQPNE